MKKTVAQTPISNENPSAQQTPNVLDNALSPYGNQASAQLLQSVPQPSKIDPALLDKFEVIDDNAIPSRENQVTADQLQKLSTLCSDIREGKSPIQLETMFSWDPKRKDAFRNGVLDDIGSILQTSTGRALLKTLSERDPYFENITIGPSGTPFCNPEDVEGAEDPLRTSAAKVGYLPNVTSHAEENLAPEDEWAHMRSDVALFHELTHAYHAATGTFQPDPVTASDGVPSSDIGKYPKDELATVGLGKHKDDPITENAYRDARKRLGGGLGEREGDSTMVQRGRYSRVHP